VQNTAGLAAIETPDGVAVMATRARPWGHGYCLQGPGHQVGPGCGAQSEAGFPERPGDHPSLWQSRRHLTHAWFSTRRI